MLVELRVLGTLSVRYNCVQAVPSARKPRQVLSLLMLSHGRVVPTSVLLAELWGDLPPRSAVPTFQGYVCQLRKSFALALGIPVMTVAESVLRTHGSGYSLAVAADTYFDLTEYRRLEAAALRYFDARDDAEAVETADRALALWHGPALADVAHGTVLAVEVAALEQARSTLLECRMEARLRLGRHRESLSELGALVMRDNYNENLNAQYMLALYRSGCRERALSVYQRLRTTMVRELGLEPSPWLQRLHSALIAADPRLDDRQAVWQGVVQASGTVASK